MPINMFEPYINAAAVRGAIDTLRSRWIGEGPRVELFEATLKEMFGYPFCVALNNGTAGLRLALAMAGVGPGDEVITTAQTCTATNMPILEMFAKPVFADIQYDTGNISPADIPHRITERTKAILCVHWAGYPCDMHAIGDLAQHHGLPVIEDAAHALGATYRGRSIGSISAFTMFSFQAIKQLTTVDGGLLTMLTRERYDEARRRRWYGIDRRHRQKRLDGYSHWNQNEVGYKYHMNDVAAAIGLGNLTDLAARLARRQEIAQRYYAHLAAVPGVTLFKRASDRISANWLFTMHVENRPTFCSMMIARGVEVSVVHIRNDEHDIFGPLREDLPVTAAYGKTQISIPLHDHLTDQQVKHVIESVQKGW